VIDAQLEPATDVVGILTNQPDERGTLIVAAVTPLGDRVALTLNVN
jgi:hypothetical protein